MNKITFIKKEKSYYTVKISTDIEESIFKISEDLLIESKFISCRELSDEELKLFLSKLPKDSLLRNALKFTDKKMRTKKEIVDHLKELTSSLSLIDSVILELDKKGLINDEKYFNLLINYLVYEKLDGPLKINEELKKLGLDYFEYSYDRAILKENINSLLTKFNLKDNSLSKDAKILKAKRYLLSHGYTVDSINSNFNYSLITVDNELDNLKKDYLKIKNKELDKSKLINKLLTKGYKLNQIEEVINNE